MADNFAVKDAAGSSVTLRTTDASGVHTTHHHSQGEVAHDAADSGNPIKVGGKASASTPTAVTDGDRVNAHFSQTGGQRIWSNAAEPVRAEGTVAQGATGTSVLPVVVGGASVAAGATPAVVSTGQVARMFVDTYGRQHVVAESDPNWVRTVFTSSNASAAAADITAAPVSASNKLILRELTVSVDTAMRVDIKEETSGTILYKFYMAANTTQTLTGICAKVATANKKIQIQTSVPGNVATTAVVSEEL